MSPKKFKIRAVARSSFGSYLKRARDFYATCEKAAAEKRWASVGLTAVHAAISACDAVLIYHAGIRSVGEDHRAAVGLLRQTLGNLPECSQKALTLQKILEKKAVVEYEEGEFSEASAREIRVLAGRFLSWVESNISE